MESFGCGHESTSNGQLWPQLEHSCALHVQSRRLHAPWMFWNVMVGITRSKVIFSIRTIDFAIALQHWHRVFCWAATNQRHQAFHFGALLGSVQGVEHTAEISESWRRAWEVVFLDLIEPGDQTSTEGTVYIYIENYPLCKVVQVGKLV